MKRISYNKEIGLLLLFFLISRLLISFAGIQLDYSALYKNWQYLDVETLRHDLLRGVWYDHTQPPLFNLFLGVVLKLSGNNAPVIFSLILKLLTLVNSFLLLDILKKKLPDSTIPFCITVVYVLSPATMIFENELFYTSVLSLLLLLSARAAVQFSKGINIRNTTGFFIPLVLATMTRSMYHILWLAFICVLVVLYYRKDRYARLLMAGSLAAMLITGGWYYKNYLIFGKFTSSTWTGMNMARNVFHDETVADPTRIEANEPFSRISVYNAFRSGNKDNAYRGLADRVLLNEMKNDSFINEKHIGYIEVSDRYASASRKAIAERPLAYGKNIIQSAITFFAPATRYPTMEFQSRKIKYYDLVYSFNVSQLASGKEQRRIALTISALPKVVFYVYIFWCILVPVIRKREIPFLHVFIVSTILYLFSVSSLFEHYENMRFRYEAEPLFLILAGIVLAGIAARKKEQAM